MAKIGSVIITPDPPQEGKNVTVTVTFTTSKMNNDNNHYNNFLY